MPEREPESWRRVDSADRARQFMPFAALKGYYDMVRERERTVEPRREMSEERAEFLDGCLKQVHRGSVVRAVYYDGSAYVERVGAIARLDVLERVIVLVKTPIALDDLWEIDVLE